MDLQLKIWIIYLLNLCYVKIYTLLLVGHCLPNTHRHTLEGGGGINMPFLQQI